MVDRTKFMDRLEVRLLRECTEAWSALDLQKGRQQGVLSWMLIDLALSTGLRVSEIERLNIEDFDCRRCALAVRRSKKRKMTTETLPIGQDLGKHLKDYIEWTDRSSGPLFASQRRDRMTRAGLQQCWKVAVKRAGLPKELSIHSARHTIAVALLKKTGNLRQVQKMLGHSTPTITANLYADVSFEDQQDSLNGLYQ